jgi:hypothetical protein
MMPKNVLLTLLTAGALSAGCVENEDNDNTDSLSRVAEPAAVDDEASEASPELAVLPHSCGATGGHYQGNTKWWVWGSHADYVVTGCFRHNVNGSYWLRLENWGSATGGYGTLTLTPNNGIPTNDVQPIQAYGGVQYKPVPLGANTYTTTLDTSTFCEYTGNNTRMVSCSGTSPTF